ncbi:DUF171-domain-containing protein [Myriangium duriaei CBS 260.36]|uniref:DUF171-domain-containing protein n=1 Tax=Myriangium duriaei CBS 260.36 TaxID=1168546 RepID=A0A9P4J8H4_9PEZI|nr:DUF171-domain-containing protein [Myriangium duriaei CBS 260.36]
MPHGAGSKKRKRESQAQAQAQAGSDRYHANNTIIAPASRVGPSSVDTSKPTAVYAPGKGRSHTLSIALPGSIIANCLTHDLKTSMCGAIARAAAVFSVDEIVIFNDGQAAPADKQHASADAASGYTGYSDPDDFLYHVLSYLETPPYLRRALFPMHPNLRTAGALPSLDMPHHLKQMETCAWREGVVVPAEARRDGSRVDCGIGARVWVEDGIEVGSRVTVKLPNAGEVAEGTKNVEAEAVRPEEPREEGGYYWGYSCRTAASLSAVFTESPFEEGYDVSVGTSERGRPVEELVGHREVNGDDGWPISKDWQHMVIVFGGVAGLEAALKADRELLDKGVTDVKDLFDHWVNLVPGQGSRTIRTEEAVWLGLMGLRQVVADRRK